MDRKRNERKISGGISGEVSIKAVPVLRQPRRRNQWIHGVPDVCVYKL